MISFSSLQSVSKSCCKKSFVWSIYEKHNPVDPSWLLTQHFTRHFILVPVQAAESLWLRKALASSQKFICLQQRLIPHTTFKLAEGSAGWRTCTVEVQFISGVSLGNSTWFPFQNSYEKSFIPDGPPIFCVYCVAYLDWYSLVRIWCIDCSSVLKSLPLFQEGSNRIDEGIMGDL